MAADPTFNASTGRWQALLSANYAQATNVSANYALAISYTPNYGLVTFDPGDTEIPTLLTRNAAQTDAVLRNGVLTLSGMSGTLFVDAAIGDDTSAARGFSRPYKTLAAAQAVAQRGDMIIFRSGSYDLTGPLTFKGVAVMSWRGATKHVNVNDNADMDEAPDGVVLNVKFGAGGSATDPAAITLYENSSLRGVTIYYPGQSIDAATPTAYPYAVRCMVTGGTTYPRVGLGGAVVEDVEIPNAYRGLEVLTGNVSVSRLWGAPLLTGIHIDGSADVVVLDQVYFNPYWDYQHASYTWKQANGTAIEVGRCDQLYARNCFAYGYKIGIHTFNSTDGRTPFTGGGYGVFSDCGMDTCTTGALIDGGDAKGWEFNSPWFCPNSGSNTGYAFRTTSNATVSLKINGGIVWSPCTTVLRAEGQGTIIWRGTQLSSPVAVDYAQIVGNNTIDIEGLLFDSTPPGAHLNISSTGSIGRVGALTCGGTNVVKVTNASSLVTVAGAPNPLCEMALSANASVASGTETKLVLGTTIKDTGGMADTTNGRITVPISGQYLITVAVRYSNLPANIPRMTAFARINGGGYYAVAEASGLAGAYPVVTRPAVVPLPAGAVVELYAAQYGGSTVALAGDGGTDNTTMSVHWIAP